MLQKHGNAFEKVTFCAFFGFRHVRFVCALQMGARAGAGRRTSFAAHREQVPVLVSRSVFMEWLSQYRGMLKKTTVHFRKSMVECDDLRVSPVRVGGIHRTRTCVDRCFQGEFPWEQLILDRPERDRADRFFINL